MVWVWIPRMSQCNICTRLWGQLNCLPILIVLSPSIPITGKVQINFLCPSNVRRRIGIDFRHPHLRPKTIVQLNSELKQASTTHPPLTLYLRGHRSIGKTSATSFSNNVAPTSNLIAQKLDSVCANVCYLSMLISDTMGTYTACYIIYLHTVQLETNNIEDSPPPHSHNPIPGRVLQ